MKKKKNFALLFSTFICIGILSSFFPINFKNNVQEVSAKTRYSDVTLIKNGGCGGSDIVNIGFTDDGCIFSGEDIEYPSKENCLFLGYYVIDFYQAEIKMFDENGKSLKTSNSNSIKVAETYTSEIVINIYAKWEESDVKTLDSISAVAKDNTYFDGYSLSASDFTVTAHYTTGASDDAVVTENITVSPTELVDGDNNITISYTEGGLTKSTEVTINAKQENEPFYFELAEGSTSASISLSISGTVDANKLKYSYGGSDWLDWCDITSASSTTLSLESTKKKVYIKGETSAWSKDDYNFRSFVISNGNVNIGGNIMSLIDYSDELKPYQFVKLFFKVKNVVDASNLNLPATTLVDSCYKFMFQGCSDLKTAPELPATTLANECYYMMFNAANLTTAPELPATTLARNCYECMFGGCPLTSIPELPAITLKTYCYRDMFSNCTKLVDASNLNLPATTLADSCYERMFEGCTSLVNAPKLPATELAVYCYNYMFSECTSLVNAPKLPATELSPMCYSYMFQGCTSLVNAPELSAETLAYCCYESMFEGCTSLTTAPELPATTLADYCYVWMFYGCKNLNSIKIGYAGNFSDNYCFDYWVGGGVSSTGTIYYDGYDTTTGVSAIPTGWAVVKHMPTTFVEKMGDLCDYNGNTTSEKLEDIKEYWNGQAQTDLDFMPSWVQSEIEEGESEAVQSMFNAYDYIYGKYGETLSLDDFLGRNLPATTNNRNKFNISNVESSTWIIAVISIIGLTSVGAYFFYRKRKEE